MTGAPLGGAIQADSTVGLGGLAGLRVEGLRKLFGGNIALDDVTLQFAYGEIHGLLGENGAGKSTLINILAGAHTADAGSVKLDGRELSPLTAEVAKRAGIGFIHQDFGLVDSLSIAENVALAVGYVRRFGSWGPISWSRTRDQAAQVLAIMDIDIDVDTKVEAVGIGVKAAVAIARAIANDVRLLVLDEATATLAAGEVASLFRILRSLAQRGVGVVFVSHRMDEVFSICDRVTVLRDGRVAGVRTVSSTSEDEVVELIVGRQVDLNAPQHWPSEASAKQSPVLEVRGLEGVAFGPVDFTVKAGEVFGLAGLAGAGQHEIAELVFGLGRPAGGRMRWLGRPYLPRHPRDAVVAGLAFVPADRATDGLSLADTVHENLATATRPGGFITSLAFIHRRRERALVDRAIKQYDIRPPEPDRTVTDLSGGNAQKVMLARCLGTEPRLVILNEPTAGVDVGAREQIYQLVRERARTNGMAVLVVSSDLEEIAALCDRVMVLHHGRESAVLAGEAVTLPRITDAALQPRRESRSA